MAPALKRGRPARPRRAEEQQQQERRRQGASARARAADGPDEGDVEAEARPAKRGKTIMAPRRAERRLRPRRSVGGTEDPEHEERDPRTDGGEDEEQAQTQERARDAAREQRRRTRLSQRGQRKAKPSPPVSRPASPPRPYAHLVAQVRRVRQSTIAAKWTPLAGPSLAAATALLQLAQQPIQQLLSSTRQRRAHTAAALRLASHRIGRKLTRGLPFPPASMAAATGADDAGRGAELDFEAVLDAKATLEARLQPAAHAVDLLRAEKARVQGELDRDYATMRRLEADARARAREHRHMLKRAHALTPRSMTPAEPRDTCALRRPDPADAPEPSIFAVRPPPSLLPVELTAELMQQLTDSSAAAGHDDLRRLVAQLGDHVKSIRANLLQVDGLAPQLARARARLQAVLLQHLDQGHYERVLLGWNRAPAS